MANIREAIELYLEPVEDDIVLENRTQVLEVKKSTSSRILKQAEMDLGKLSELV